MEEEASHLKIVDGEFALGHSVNNVLRPLDAPDNGSKGSVPRQPNASSSTFASITVSNISRVSGDELAALDWMLSHHFEHGSEVLESKPLRGIRMDLNSALVGAFCSVQSPVQWG